MLRVLTGFDGCTVLTASVDVDTLFKSCEDGVGVDATSVFTELHDLAAAFCAGTDEGGVVDDGRGVGLCVRVRKDPRPFPHRGQHLPPEWRTRTVPCL